MSLLKQIQALLDKEEKSLKKFIESEWYDRYDLCDMGGVSVLEGKIDAYKKIIELIKENKS